MPYEYSFNDKSLTENFRKDKQCSTKNMLKELMNSG